MSEETVGRRVTHYRLRRGLKKSQLAKYSGVSRSYITRLEKGEIRSPSSNKLLALAKELHVTTDELASSSAPTDAELNRVVDEELSGLLAGTLDLPEADREIVKDILRPIVGRNQQARREREQRERGGREPGEG